MAETIPAHEAQPLVGEQVTVAVRRGAKSARAQLHGRLLAAGAVGVLLANGKGYGLFPWHTIESIIATEPTAAVDEAQLVAAAALRDGGAYADSNKPQQGGK